MFSRGRQPLACGVGRSGIVPIGEQDTVHHRLLQVDGGVVVDNPAAIGVVERRVVDLHGGVGGVDAAAVAGRVAGDRAVLDGDRAARVDAAAVAGRVAGDRAPVDDQHPVDGDAAATAAWIGGRVAGDRAVLDGQVLGVDAAALRCRVARDRAPI